MMQLKATFNINENGHSLYKTCFNIFQSAQYYGIEGKSVGAHKVVIVLDMLKNESLNLYTYYAVRVTLLTTVLDCLS